MATKDSRLAQIYRQELAKNKGLLGAFASAGGARIKEAVDLRQYLLPQSGISGAISQRMFGKAYRYSSGQPGVRTAGSGSPINDRVVSEKITRVDINTKLTAKNTIVLPAMARDMNLMRMNMQKMVKLSGGTPSTKADMFFKRAGDRESAYESQFRKQSILSKPNDTLKPVSEEKGGVLGGLLQSLLSPSALKFILGAGIGGSIWNSLDEGTKTSIGSFFKDLMLGFFNGLKGAFDTITSFLSDPDVIKSIQELTLSILNSIGAALQSVFSTEIDTPMGKMSLGTIVTGLTIGLGALLPVVKSLTGVLGVAAAAIAGWKIGSVLNDAINTIRNATSEDWNKNNREEDGIDPALTNPSFVAHNKRLAQKQIQKDEQSISAIQQEIADLEAGKKIGYDVPHRKQILEGRIDKLKENIEKSKSKTIQPVRVDSAPSTSPSTSPSKQELSSRSSIEAYLGRAISDDELDYLYRATYAESAHSKDSYANVMAVILNRTRKNGKSIIDTLVEENQFQAVTGTKNNPGPSPHFKSGPSEKNLKMLEGASKDILPNISKNLDSFTATDPKAYVEGTSMAWLDKLKNAPGSFEKSGTLFAENQYNGKYKGAATLTASAKELKPQTPPDKEDPIIGEVTAMLAGVFKAIGATNTSIQSLAVASSAKPQQSASIASPYDKELYELLLAYHSDIATPLGT
jgi:hypothetical protein